MYKQYTILLLAVILMVKTLPSISAGTFDYTSCVNSTCFGFPDSNCIENLNCSAAVRTWKDDAGFAFEMFTNFPNSSYIAFGISQTARMESSLVLESVIFEGVQSEYASHNVPVVRRNVREGTVSIFEIV